MQVPARPAGLSEAEAQRRLAEHGPNAIEERERRSLATTLRQVAREPMFLLLLVAAGVYLLVGDLGEGLLLSCFALLSVGLVIVQQRRSERALDALRALAAPQARVLRAGQVRRLPAREIVPGDWIVLSEGERIAADAVLRQGEALAVDESLLTGESVPVRKRASDAPLAQALAGVPGGDDQPQVHAGTLVTSGHGLAEVGATGRHTQVGRIGVSLAAIEPATAPLEHGLRRLVRLFGTLALAGSTLLVLWHGLRGGEWVQGLLAGIALGMAMLPEEFPMALAVFLALGSWRLARAQVLVRHPSAVGVLGAASVLCVDKTGTLTENRMALRRLVTLETDVVVEPGAPLPATVQPLLECAMLASRRGGTDPMDRALLACGDAALAGSTRLHPGWRLEREYALTPELPAMSQVWLDEQGGRHAATKGAPEAVIALCRLAPETAAALLAQARALAESGLRVLAVASGNAARPEPAADQRGLELYWLGLVGFEDPLRASVPAAVAQARGAGIAVVMITGDHAATALAIARQAGIETTAGVLTGQELALLDDAALDQAVRQVRVFARVRPEQKLRLVEALQRNGETVVMTGDGVNDAPALKAAHIGIAMGVRGTDVAREAADLVLLDEDFGRIVDGVRMGRHIFDNLRKVMRYIIAIHVPLGGLALVPVLLGLPPLMLPAHVVLTEMVIDPICSLAFEGAPPEPRLMQRPPRRADEGLLGTSRLLDGLLQGGSVLLATLLVYILALRAGQDADVARTLAVVGLTAGNLLLVAANLSADLGWRALLTPGARAFWIVALIAAGVLALAIAVPQARALLHFAPAAPAQLGLTLVAVALAAAVGMLPGRALARRPRSTPA